MTPFLEAMAFVEEQHVFPERLEEFHARRFAWLLKRSGLGEELPPLVVITGSCGKASTTRFLASMLNNLGLKVGIGTKPPVLETPDGNRERYQTSSGWIEPDEFAAHVDVLRPLCSELERAHPEWGRPAPYDLRAFILLRHFREYQVDLGLFEGNIGRLHDPCGQVPARLTIITPIATDHAGLLPPPDPLPPCLEGLGECAGPVWHKAHDVSSPVVLGRQSPPVAEALSQLLSGPVTAMGPDYHVNAVRPALEATEVEFRVSGRDHALRLQTLGAFQGENAACAAAALLALGLPFASDRLHQAIREGAEQTTMPGRMQTIDQTPLTILNVASSPVKVNAMMDSLETMLAGRPLVVVATLLDRIHGGRDAIARITRSERLAGFVATAFYDHGDSHDVESESLAGWVRQDRPDLPVEAVANPAAAVDRGRQMAGPEGAVLLLGNGLCQALEDRLR